MNDKGEAPETLAAGKRSLWSRVLLIALAGVLVAALVVGVAFAVTGTGNGTAATGTQVRDCSGGTGCRGSAVESCGRGNSCAGCDGECERKGEECDGKCETGCEGRGDCVGDNDCERGTAVGSDRAGRCHRNRVPQ